jgi:hypothetical protein
MTTYVVGSIAEFNKLFAKHQEARQKAVIRGLQRTAIRGAKELKLEIPVAFGELRDSVHPTDKTDGATITIDAPHAAPVEIGSRPHTPPLAPLVEWMRLRGSTNPVQDAKKLQHYITVNGTKPHWYARSLLPTLKLLLGPAIMSELKASERGLT